MLINIMFLIIYFWMNFEMLRKEILQFRDDRDRKQFHNPKDLSVAISIEANELMEKFLWKSQSESYKLSEDEDIKDEFADVFNYLILFADACKIDIEESVLNKIKKNNDKYPVNKSKWNSDKYNKL